jgi:hypothetical protein
MGNLPRLHDVVWFNQGLQKREQKRNNSRRLRVHPEYPG